MSRDDLLSVCSLLLPAVVMWFLRVHRETEHDRQRAVHRQIDVLTLRAGETVVGVIDRSHRPSIFLVHDTTDGRDDA
jgi:hypothetical protein